MSTELETRMTEHTAVRLFGGDDRGMVVQITSSKPLTGPLTANSIMQQEGYIQLTMEEAVSLCNCLCLFVQEEAKRRRVLLQEELDQLKIQTKTVFQEVAELPDSIFAGNELAVGLVSRFCPKSRQQRYQGDSS